MCTSQNSVHISPESSTVPLSVYFLTEVFYIPYQRRS